MSRIYGPPVNRKLSSDDADAIRRMVAAGYSQRSVAAEFGVSKVTVNGIVRGRFYLDPVRKQRPEAGTIRAGTETHFSCGHERSEENTRDNGSPNGCCRTCNNALAQRNRSDAKAARVAREEARRQSDSAAVATYRTEKALAEERKRRTVIAAAKREFDAMLERERQARKGGRPKGSGQNFGKSARPIVFARRCEPGDELLVALGHYGGA